jgi:hypothetical protein
LELPALVGVDSFPTELKFTGFLADVFAETGLPFSI